MNNKTSINRNYNHCSLQKKLNLSFLILTIITSSLSFLILYKTVQSKMRKDIQKRIFDIAIISALGIDGDLHSTLVDSNQEGDAAYIQIKHLLQKIRNREPDIQYIYTWRRSTEGKLIFVVDAETNPKNISHIGDVYDTNNGANPHLLARLNALENPMVDKNFTTDKWGTWLSGYAPFYRSDGKIEGILGIDFAAKDVISYERHFMLIAITIFGITTLMASILGRLIGRRLAAPILKLTAGIERIIKGDLNHRVKINSNDEVGSLAESFNRMAESLQNTIMDRDLEIENRTNAENALEALNVDLVSTIQQLSLANHELKDFAYIAAHDLKSPVRAIGSIAGMILESCGDTLDEPNKQLFDMLIQRAERLNVFIGGILKYSTLERKTLLKEQTDINIILKEVIKTVDISKKNIEIIIENELPIVICQKTHIAEIFQNLLDNAIKYMDKLKGQISIGCVEQNNFWKFKISDNGPGIKEEYLENIFKLCHTLNRRDKFESSGIGLALVRKIVELYNGKIWAESKIGEGSTFFLLFPKQNTVVNKEKSYVNSVG